MIKRGLRTDSEGYFAEQFDGGRPDYRIVNAEDAHRQTDSAAGGIAIQFFGQDETALGRRIDRQFRSGDIYVGRGRPHGARGGENPVAE